MTLLVKILFHDKIWHTPCVSWDAISGALALHILPFSIIIFYRIRGIESSQEK